MKKIIVLGGGLAGLSTAVSLCSQNYKITLLESSPKLGGRTYSFYDKNLLLNIDNGQHALMGCYKFTLDYLKKIGSLNNLVRQDNLSVTFVDETSKLYDLKAEGRLYPLNFLNALIKFRLFSFSEKVSLIKIFSKLLFLRPSDYLRKTIEEWLIEERQSAKVIKNFWEFLAVSALNSSIQSASASMFISILQEVFLHGNKATAILTPKNGLSELLINPAEIYLRKHDSEIKLSESVKGLVVSNNKIVEILTDKSNYKDFDAVISAVPYEAINKIVELGAKNFLPEYSSIVSIQVKLQNNPLNDDYYALVNSPIHWVFNNKTHLSLVISGADGFSNLPKEQISAIAKEELAKYFRISEDNISGTTVIKEKRATYVPNADFISNRPGSVSHIDNLILAGDWIDTKLPCTIESAVKSGYLAADIVKRIF